MLGYAIPVYKLLHLVAVCADTGNKQLCVSAVFVYKLGKSLIQYIISFEWLEKGEAANGEWSAVEWQSLFVRIQVGVDSVGHSLPIKVAAKQRRKVGCKFL